MVLAVVIVGAVVGIAAGVTVGVAVARRAALVAAASVTQAHATLRGQVDAAARHDLHVRQQSFEQRTRELRGELARVTDLVAALQRERAEQQGRVESRLAEVVAVSGKLADTTQSLRQALANPKARGQWGERMADDVLRAAGLVEGISYRKQSSTRAGTVPDFTFSLPGGRCTWT
jgi:DNA anti-recombination protein RmuC